jgi:phosphohistidine swiveling domain-containing protein
VSMNTSDSYSLHFRQTDLPFIFIDILFRRHNYGRFDYIVLQKKDQIASYLSEEGRQQAYDFGSKLLDKEFSDKIIKELEMLLLQLKSNSLHNQLQSIKQDNFVSRWEIIEALCDKVGYLYLYCEQPVQVSLENIVIKACSSDDDLVKVLHDPAYAKTIGFGKEQMDMLAELIRFGELKFAIHNALGPLFEDLYAFIRNVAKKYNFSVEQIFSLKSNELHDLLSGKRLPDKDILNERLAGLVLLPKRGAVDMVLTGKDYLLWKDRIEPKNKEVRGSIAYSGKAEGIVKVHLSVMKGEDIPKGTVLVSGMTNPQIVPYLKNAVAIVTDEGGLTCHAAIVSRELKIPCIVGTKVATQVFKDGDFVEVDADSGVVRKIK